MVEREEAGAGRQEPGQGSKEPGRQCTVGQPLQGQRHGGTGGSYPGLRLKEACPGRDSDNTGTHIYAQNNKPSGFTLGSKPRLD